MARERLQTLRKEKPSSSEYVFDNGRVFFRVSHPKTIEGCRNNGRVLFRVAQPEKNQRMIIATYCFLLFSQADRSLEILVSDSGTTRLVSYSGTTRLHKLGYKQELRIKFGMIPKFRFFMGPIVMTYGWFIAGLFTMFVGLSMAEICSSNPTFGGL